MNAVVALCHFCEMHGPTVMTCTQPLEKSETTDISDDGRRPSEDFVEGSLNLSRNNVAAGSDSDLTELDTFDMQDSSSATSCTACRSFPKSAHGFVTYGDDGDLWYMTLQQPYNPEVFTFLRQACVRSLSSEISPGREGPIFFGDDQHGYVYSYTFYLKDNEARGMQRWYSIVVLSMDKITMMQSWPFFTRSFRSLVTQLQNQAETTFAADQAEKPQRVLRLGASSSINPENFRRQRRGKALRSLPDLTADQNVFHFIHEHFTHLLQLGGNQMCETLLEGSPSCYVPVDSSGDSGQGCDGPAFMACLSRPLSRISDASDFDGSTGSPEQGNSLPKIRGIVHLYELLGKVMFRKLAYHVVIGNQVVVRGFHDFLVISAIKTLEILIPHGCRKSIYFSPNYEEPWTGNLLGIHPDTSYPENILSAKEYFVVDVVAAKMNEMDIKKYRFISPSPNPVQSSMPAYLNRLEAILSEPEMDSEVAEALIVNLQERILTKVKVLYKLFRTESRTEDQLLSVMEKMQIPKEDKAIMTFWMSALTNEYKVHLKELSLPLSLSSPSSRPASRRPSKEPIDNLPNSTVHRTVFKDVSFPK